MPELPFTWDPKKARQNLAKHRVSFEEASTVFYDEQALEMEGAFSPFAIVCERSGRGSGSSRPDGR